MEKSLSHSGCLVLEIPAQGLRRVVFFRRYAEILLKVFFLKALHIYDFNDINLYV